ncbi:MAG: hypothetical protein WAW88_02565, partial [Nocardioides sp.]
QVLRRRRESGQEILVDDLRAIETSARQAMAELRQVLSALRMKGDSSFGLDRSIDQVSELVEQCQDAGQGIDFVVSGEPQPMTVGGSLAAYRIVQESLTNARRHGSSGTVQLRVGWRKDVVELFVRNPVVRSPKASLQPGVGIVGMRERLSLCGGQLAIGPLEPGAWVVRATVPTADPS